MNSINRKWVKMFSQDAPRVLGESLQGILGQVEKVLENNGEHIGQKALI